MVEKIEEVEFEDKNTNFGTVKQLYHLVVTINTGGRSNVNGQKGTVLFEDYEVPYDFVQWFIFRCAKATKISGYTLLVYCNDKLVSNDGIDPNLIDNEVNPSELRQTLDINQAQNTLSVLTGQVRLVENQIIELYKELDYNKKKTLEEINICDARIRKARDECDFEVKRNQDLAKYHREEFDAELKTFSDLRKLQVQEKIQAAKEMTAYFDVTPSDPKPLIDTLTDNGIKFLSNPAVGTLLEKLLASRNIPRP